MFAMSGDALCDSATKMLLVLVGKNTIRYNDMLGQSLEVPVEKPTANSRESKVSHAQ